MLRYVRTKDGKFFDIVKVQSEIQDNPLYKDYRDWTLERTEDSNGLLKMYYTVFDTQDNTRKDFVMALCNGEEVQYSDKLEDLCDDFVVIDIQNKKQRLYFKNLEEAYDFIWQNKRIPYELKGNIYTSTGSMFVVDFTNSITGKIL